MISLLIVYTHKFIFVAAFYLSLIPKSIVIDGLYEEICHHCSTRISTKVSVVPLISFFPATFLVPIITPPFSHAARRWICRLSNKTNEEAPFHFPCAAALFCEFSRFHVTSADSRKRRERSYSSFLLPTFTLIRNELSWLLGEILSLSLLSFRQPRGKLPPPKSAWPVGIMRVEGSVQLVGGVIWIGGGRSVSLYFPHSDA